MAVEVEAASNRPRGYFAVWQRLLRGYGPLAGFIVVMIVMSILVPSKVQKVVETGVSAGAESEETGDTTPAEQGVAGETPVGEEVSTPAGPRVRPRSRAVRATRWWATRIHRPACSSAATTAALRITASTRKEIPSPSAS